MIHFINFFTVIQTSKFTLRVQLGTVGFARQRFRHGTHNIVIRQDVLSRKFYSISILPLLLVSQPPIYVYVSRRGSYSRLPVELVGGHAEKDSDDRVNGDERWSGQKLVLETESVVIPFAERCTVFVN